MDFTIPQGADNNEALDSSVRDLNDLELALIGGGIADPLLS